MRAAASPAGVRVRVWDLPTRLAHWAIVTLFALCWWSAESGHMRWHLLSGYALLGVVWFRIAWGFCGSETSRFRNFVRGPRATAHYVRKLLRGERDGAAAPLGHNPLGALSILAMLTLLVLQTSFGMFAVDIDGYASGPLSRWVSFHTGRVFAHLHAFNFNLLLVLVALHLSAITYYRVVRKERLVPAMIHGRKDSRSMLPAPYFAPWWQAALLAAGIFACVALVVHLR